MPLDSVTSEMIGLRTGFGPYWCTMPSRSSSFLSGRGSTIRKRRPLRAAGSRQSLFMVPTRNLPWGSHFPSLKRKPGRAWREGSSPGLSIASISLSGTMAKCPGRSVPSVVSPSFFPLKSTCHTWLTPATSTRCFLYGTTHPTSSPMSTVEHLELLGSNECRSLPLMSTKCSRRILASHTGLSPRMHFESRARVTVGAAPPAAR
mmetsp:Transcript_27127/g.68349  ORF Transcript_27127/g.68349 Transcript_27127/m.68349 type:complete len:204 (-) Transcript_27127:147-758(-)